MNTAEKKYYKQVKKKIPGFTKKRKELLNMLQYSLTSYSQSHEGPTYSDYISNFGTPDEYANTLMEQMDTDNLKQSIRSRNKLLLIVSIGIVLLLLAVFVWGHILHHTMVKGYVDIIIYTTTTEETIDPESETTTFVEP